jgi:hypothetical protein
VIHGPGVVRLFTGTGEVQANRNTGMVMVLYRGAGVVLRYTYV